MNSFLLLYAGDRIQTNLFDSVKKLDQNHLHPLFYYLMRETGFEPAKALSHWNLNPARLTAAALPQPFASKSLTKMVDQNARKRAFDTQKRPKRAFKQAVRDAGMIPIKPIRQKPSWCGPACLGMILTHYGKAVSQSVLAKDARTTLAQGTLPTSLVQAARKHGFIAHYEEGTFDSLHRLVVKQGIPVMVDWWSADDGHYSVCVHLTKKNIWLADPEVGQIRKLEWKTFYRNWFDFRGDFIRIPSDIRLRGMIVIHPSGPKKDPSRL